MINEKYLKGRFQQKTDIEKNWEKAKNFIPLDGEIIIYKDIKKLKVGDGVTAIGALDFINSSADDTPGLKTAEGGEIFNDYENNTAGARGYYIKSIDTKNKKIYLTIDGTIQPIFDTTDNTDPSFETPAYGFYSETIDEEGNVVEVRGDEFSICSPGVYHWPLCSTIYSVSNNVVTYYEDIFDPISKLGGLNEDGLPYQFIVPSKPYIGSDVLSSYSTAEGNTTASTGIASHAEGYGTTAAGWYSHAEGLSTKAGYGAHAENECTFARGVSSHAEGYSTVSSGINSHAEGNKSVSSGNFSHAEGHETHSDGLGSHTEGHQTYASSSYTHAEGVQTRATGGYAHAEGCETVASGATSHAQGYLTVASGAQSHTEGYKTQATNARAHAEGTSTVAAGVSSHAEGMSTYAGNSYTHAEGCCIAPTTHSYEFKAVLIGGTTSTYTNEGFKSPTVGTLLWGSNNNVARVISVDAEADTYTTDNPVLQFEAFENDAVTSYAVTYKYGATGAYSHAEGVDTLASGATSHVEGYLSVSSGQQSHAQGYKTTASGNRAHAEGQETNAIANAAHAEGHITTASGVASHAEGYNTKAIGQYSHAEGDSTEAKGLYSHAEGQNTKAHHNWAHAEGCQTTASGTTSHTEGYLTIASSDQAHAEGLGSQATNYRTHAEGNYTIASGDTSHAEGYKTTAASAYQHVQGKFNKIDSNNVYAHIVGNGNAENNRSNAHTVDWDGNAWFAGKVTVGADPTSDLDVVTLQYLEKLKQDGSLQGPKGADGKTPVKGVDYYTEADKTEMVNAVLSALPTWEGGSY